MGTVNPAKTALGVGIAVCIATSALLPRDSVFFSGDGGIKGPITGEYKVEAFPTLMVLDANGVIRYKWRGAPNGDVIDKPVVMKTVRAGAFADLPRDRRCRPRPLGRAVAAGVHVDPRELADGDDGRRSRQGGHGTDRQLRHRPRGG